ncbi:MAG: hypothetical protein PHC61_15735, partial [Chitinivibrionales bacterium]|nr:hypothetical protein [Chitinivibrionales bacterium]
MKLIHRNHIVCALLFPVALSLGCSRNHFESSSSVGQGVFAGNTNVLLNPANAFKIFNDSLPLAAAVSFVDPGDTIHSIYHRYIQFGSSVQYENTITCGMLFGTRAFGIITFSDTALLSFYNQHQGSIGAKSLSLVFSDSLRAPCTIRIYSVTPFPG